MLVLAVEELLSSRCHSLGPRREPAATAASPKAHVLPRWQRPKTHCSFYDYRSFLLSSRPQPARVSAAGLPRPSAAQPPESSVHFGRCSFSSSSTHDGRSPGHNRVCSDCDSSPAGCFGKPGKLADVFLEAKTGQKGTRLDAGALTPGQHMLDSPYPP